MKDELENIRVRHRPRIAVLKIMIRLKMTPVRKKKAKRTQ